MNIMRGDAYTIQFTIKEGATYLTPSNISDIELCIGKDLKKTYSDNQIIS